MAVSAISGDIRTLDPNALRNTLRSMGITRIDTAALYRKGESEKIIGRSGLAQDFTIDTKILWTPPGDGAHTAEAVERSLKNSLEVLGVKKVNVLYCHGPDYVTPVYEQARAFDAQYKKGLFNHLGVSNFSPKMLSEWLTIASMEGLVKPSVYQGQYNLVCRALETELFPLLKEHNIAFNAYSPLAGGFLLGNFTTEGVQGGSRFAMNSPFLTWYDKPAMHDAIKDLRALSRSVGIGMDELSLRWIVHHSKLGKGDAVIAGASKVEQLERKMAQIRKGPLHRAMVRELERLSDQMRRRLRRGSRFAISSRPKTRSRR